MSRFAVVPTAWLRDPALTPLDKLVLTLLASYADRNGYCWPGIRQLASDCTVSERTLQYSLRRLQQAGAILVEPRQRANGSLTSNAYWIAGYDLPPQGGVVQPAAPGVVQPIAPPRCNPLHHQNSTSRTVPERTEEKGPDDDDTPECQTLADTDKGEKPQSGVFDTIRLEYVITVNEHDRLVSVDHLAKHS